MNSIKIPKKKTGIQTVLEKAGAAQVAFMGHKSRKRLAVIALGLNDKTPQKVIDRMLQVAGVNIDEKQRILMRIKKGK